MERQAFVVLGLFLFALAGVVAIWLIVQWRLASRPVIRPLVVPRSAGGEGRRPLSIRPLLHDDAVRLGFAWRLLQARFIEDPRGAVNEADRLFGEILAARGFPLGEIEAYADQLAGPFPALTENYQRARSVALRQHGGYVAAADVREAFISYAVMVEDLLEPKSSSPERAHDWS